MKFKLFIDPDREEEILVYAHQESPLTQALRNLVEREQEPLLGWQEVHGLCHCEKRQQKNDAKVKLRGHMPSFFFGEIMIYWSKRSSGLFLMLYGDGIPVVFSGCCRIVCPDPG